MAVMAPPSSDARKTRTILIPLLLLVIFLAEVSFLSRLDMAKNVAVVHSWTESFYSSSSPSLGSSLTQLGVDGLGTEMCEEFLEREDAVPYSRDFNVDPVWILGGEKEYKSCAVPCSFEPYRKAGKKADASFRRDPGASDNLILRSMESSHYYPELNIANARRKGYNIIMTTSLSSDVPVGYFSWAEYDIMLPPQPKTEKALAAAFISNCGARNFRLEALNMLEKYNISIDSYGACHRNKDGNVNKVETLKKYKFSLAFENSNEEDYVTEKFFQALVAGTIPVVIGPPNILEFAPSHDSALHISTLDDVPSVAKTMKHLAKNPQAYNSLLRWKFDGPSDSFKALVDMAVVHSSCRLCIHVATKVHDEEERSNSSFQKRPCKCIHKDETVYHLFVRERGSFQMKSIFLRSSNLTLRALESAVFTKFRSENHIPIWMEERPQVLRKGDYKVYRIYPVSLTQRQALYGFKFNRDADFRQFVESHPCAKLEVIFV